MSLVPSRTRRPAPKSLLDGDEMQCRRRIHDPAALWLKQARRADPERYRAIARRHPVLSLWQVDRRRALECPLELDHVDDDDQASASQVDREIHRLWLGFAFGEVA